MQLPLRACKNKATSLMLLAMCVQPVVLSQRPCGIYQSGQDYLDHIMMVDIASENKSRIVLHEIFFRPFIDIRSADTAYQMKKDSLFGYEDCDGNAFRFYKKSIYSILETGVITLYSKSTYGGDRSNRQVVQLFFSKKINSEIFDVTMENILAVYSENKKLNEFLVMQTTSDRELIQRVGPHKAYFIRLLIEQCKSP